MHLFALNERIVGPRVGKGLEVIAVAREFQCAFLHFLSFTSKAAGVVGHSPHINFVLKTPTDSNLADLVGFSQLVAAAVVKRLQPLLPSHKVAGVQITDQHVGRKEEIDALALVNIGLAISCQFNDPALIDFLEPS